MDSTEYLRAIKELIEILQLLQTALETQLICKKAIQDKFLQFQRIANTQENNNFMSDTDNAFQIISDRQGTA